MVYHVVLGSAYQPAAGSFFWRAGCGLRSSFFLNFPFRRRAQDGFCAQCDDASYLFAFDLAIRLDPEEEAVLFSFSDELIHL